MPAPGQWEQRSRRPAAPAPNQLSGPPAGSVGQNETTAGPPGPAAPLVDASSATSGRFRGTREPAAWVKASFAAVVMLGGMLLVMWLQQGSPLCATSHEASRRLQLSRPGDREHLATDSASAVRSAHQYVSSEADTPERQQRFLTCEASLVQAIATTHDVSIEQVRASEGYVQ